MGDGRRIICLSSFPQSCRYVAAHALWSIYLLARWSACLLTALSSLLRDVSAQSRRSRTCLARESTRESQHLRMDTPGRESHTAARRGSKRQHGCHCTESRHHRRTPAHQSRLCSHVKECAVQHAEGTGGNKRKDECPPL